MKVGVLPIADLAPLYLGMERNAVLHRRILEISAHRVSRDICARLNSQMVRFQFRTVLAPGRSGRSMAEHQRIVEAIAAGDRLAAEQAMRTHLTNVSSALIELADPERAAIGLGQAAG